MPVSLNQLPANRRILVVDDDPDVRDLLTALLRPKGYTIATAANGQEGLAVIGKQTVDLILLDFRMPIMDGRTFAENLVHYGSPIPIVLISADADARIIAEEIDADAYLPKPFHIARLLNLVDQLVGVPRVADGR